MLLCTLCEARPEYARELREQGALRLAVQHFLTGKVQVQLLCLPWCSVAAAAAEAAVRCGAVQWSAVRHRMFCCLSAS